MPLLPGDLNLIAVDLLGCGDSSKPLSVSYSIKNHANILKEMMDQLELEQVHLVGHDVGGGIAQIMAVNHPNSFKTLSLLNSVGHDFWPVQPIITMQTPIIRQLALATLDFGMFRMIVSRGLHNKGALTKALMDLFLYPMKTQIGRKAFLHFAKCLDNTDLVEIEAALNLLNVPTLILRGDQDVYLSSNIAQKLNRDIPDSTLEILEQGGHFFQEEIPTQIVEKLKDQFKK